ncbi:F-box only protein 34 [Melanotaenia boesemani]|uniref:F-box only protein 34 n=1 Tax=Melanotaenia boesemani TaxID=1250792 RepID=UPI001C0417F0|nr:F-box only protein 34 [Melanotaenia boesemani]XP_041827646.1 F-box only protein 34 [Melanotaenia boesemani]
MHLKSYPKLVRSELHVDAAAVHGSSQRSSLFVSQQGGMLRTFTSNHGNISSSRCLPLSIMSNNTLCYTNTISNVTSLRLKMPSHISLQPPPSPPGSEKSHGLYQTRTEDVDTGLNMWTVIKPGHVREKIAIFASEDRWADGAGGCQEGNTNSLSTTGMSRAVKTKWGWEENSSTKRRRFNQKFQQDKRTGILDEPAPRQSDGSLCGGRLGEEEEQEQKLSVVEMVAFLEQRASEQQPDLKPLLALQRSSTTITLAKVLPLETKGEEPENIRVSEMVARLESECLKRRTEEGLSRSNSLRRAVGRVLLASGAAVTSSSSAGALSQSEKPALKMTPPSGELFEGGDNVTEVQPLAPPPPSEEAEPLPGLLFLSLPPSEMTPPQTPRSNLCTPHYRTSFYLEPARAQTLQPPVSPVSCGSGSQSEETVCVPPFSVAVPFIRSASASQDFLERRQRLQRLLAPQPFLLMLPHHLLVQILLLLPTQSLAALKCSCTYFKFIIENYGLRPADSLWVSDPRYRDDPCKQCKKCYGPGDVSLCRWHHKPYCQALPYGPGYWMCCHSTHRDAPGCNVGLHDNRWVPSFHSMNMPIYRRSCNHDN